MASFKKWIEDKRKGFVGNIENITESNNNFRKVLYTAKNSQLVVMSLKPNEEIGNEIHEVDQFFRIEKGSGNIVINGNKSYIKEGFGIIVPAGSEHNIINTGTIPLKLYSIYSPPHHLDKTVHKTKSIAEKSKETFNGKVSEKIK